MVSPASASGMVTFYDGVYVLGTGPLAGGLAVLTTRALGAGVRMVRAYYAGDGMYAASSTPAMQLVVQAVAGNAFQSHSMNGGFTALAVGDFNGDGKPDLIAPGYLMIGNGDGTFQAPVAYNISYFGGRSVAVGDFNQDGNLDVVEVTIDGSVVVQLGNGDGTFRAPSSYGAGGYVAAADFNGDGKIDLAITRAGGFSVLLGNGDGTFQPPVFNTINRFAGFLAVGDFNGDGIPDLVTAYGSVSVFLGNGDGTFQDPVDYLTHTDTVSVAIGDFNHDGKADLALAYGNSTGVLLGNGDGTFQPAPNFQVGTFTYSGALEAVASGDFNGDGTDDLTCAVFRQGVDVVYGSPTGFSAPPRYFIPTDPPPGFDPASAQIPAVVVADFNGDGIADIAVSNGWYLTILLGVAAPTSTMTLMSSANPSTYGQSNTLTATVSTATGGPVEPGIIDFYDGPILSAGVPVEGGSAVLNISQLASGDHQFTVVYSGDGNDGSSASSLLQTVNQGVAEAVLRATPSPASAGQNVLLAATLSSPLATGTVTFLDGSTTLGSAPVHDGAAQIFVSTLAPGSHLLTAQYSGDANFPPTMSGGVTQVVMAASATTLTLTSSANPAAYGRVVTLTATISPLTGTGKVTFYDGAKVLGTQSIVTGGAVLATALMASGAHSITAFYGGDASNAASTSTPLVQTMAPVAAFGFQPILSLPGVTGAIWVDDFNGDGKPDLLIAGAGYNGPGIVAVALGNGDGTFQPQNVVYRSRYPYAGEVSAATGDFNGDGIVDIVICNHTVNSYSVALGNGDGTFQPAVSYTAGGGPVWVVVGDFNGDGIADLAFANDGKSASVLLGNGDGTFQAETYLSSGMASLYGSQILVADLNGDGKADLVVANGYPRGTMTVLLGNGDGTFAAPAEFASDTGVLAVGDFNGDGAPDIAIASIYGGVTIVLGNGDGSFQAPVNYGVGYSGSIAVGDMDGDGKVDIAVSYGALRGNGDGTFLPPVVFATSPGYVVIADFNGDGRPDIADSGVGVLLGAGDSSAATRGSWYYWGFR
jgi:hypothetical protein